MRFILTVLAIAFLVAGIHGIAHHPGSAMGGVGIGIAVTIIFWAMDRAAKEARR